MKGKIYVFLLVLFAILMFGTILVVAQEKINVSAPSIILPNQNLNVRINQDLHEDSIKNNWITLRTSDGEKVDASIDFSTSGEISVEQLPIGAYELTVNKSSFGKKKFWIVDQKISFEVVETLTKVKNDQALLAYFKEIEKEARTTVSDNMGSVEESFLVADKASQEYSTTNNQVEGIEEGDTTITDGQYLYIAVENSIQIVEAKRNGKMKKESVIKLGEYAYIHQLFLHDNLLLVTYTDGVNQADNQWIDYTKVAIYDLTNQSQPVLLRDYGHEGYFRAARKTIDTFYLISVNSPQYSIAINEKKMDLLKPIIYDSSSAEKVGKNEEIYILPDTHEPTYTTISAIDLMNITNQDIKTESYLGSSDGFYMSDESMYLTSVNYYSNMSQSNMLFDMILEPKNTTIYRFAIDQQTIEFKGQAFIDGSILNQFSMDEYDGYLRVATTKGNARNIENSSTSGILVFDEVMNQVGEIHDLAKGERIYSARFIGEKAYVVTFKEMDPLFTFDLSNPKQPKLLGELKIPGFSTYLHPIGENHLLGLGYDTKIIEQDGRQFVRGNGVKLALFDVSDLQNPKEQDVEIIGGESSYSEAIDNHKMLFIDHRKGIFGFPVVIYNTENGSYNKFKGQGAVFFKVDTEKGISLTKSFVSSPVGESYENYEEQTRKIMYIDEILYFIKDNRLESYSYKTYEQIAELYFK